MDNLTDAESQQIHASSSVKPNPPRQLWPEQVDILRQQRDWSDRVILRLVSHIEHIGGDGARVLENIKADLEAPEPVSPYFEMAKGMVRFSAARVGEKEESHV